MNAGEQARHKLHTRLAETLEPEEAETMMDSVPPPGWWSDIATEIAGIRRDLDTRRTSSIRGSPSRPA